MVIGIIIEMKKVLFFDIETAPMKIWAWDAWETNALAIDQDWYMISFSAKWLGGKYITKGLIDYPSYRRNPTDDKALVSELAALFEEADIIIGHNGDGFDIKKTNERIIFHGFTPPSPYKTIDTLKIARKYFKFSRNNLNYICERLGLGQKIRTGGKDLWFDCMSGDMAAWRKMLAYNKHDVTLLEGVYKKFLPWIKNHPAMNTHEESCPKCNSKEVQARGPADKKDWHRFRCKTCGGWFQRKIKR